MEQFKERFPVLAGASKVILNSPSSSSAIERMFFESSNMLTKISNRLGGERIYQKLLIRHSEKFMTRLRDLSKEK